MALVSCPECGEKVSTDASACPHCGSPEPSAAQEASSEEWQETSLGGLTGCLVFLFVVGIIVWIVASLIGDGDTSESRAAVDRCETVPASLMSKIESGLTVQGGGTISDAAAVRSEDFERIYFIAGEIDGPGFEEPGHVGVWASNRLEGDGGFLFAVGSVAQGLSDWGPGDRTDANLTMADDGVREAVGCLRE